MANRYTATEKWDKAWFCELSPSLKLFFIYLCDNCNNAGIWDVNWGKVRFYTGIESSVDPSIFGRRDDGQPRIIELSKSKWFIRTFVLFQQKIKSVNDLNPDNGAHKQILAILKKEGVFAVSPSKQTLEGHEGGIDAPPVPLARGLGIGKGIGIKRGIVKGGEERRLFLEFVYMTQGQYDQLAQKLGKTILDQYVERLNNHIGSKGTKYKSHYHTILSWTNEDGVGKPIAEARLPHKEVKTANDIYLSRRPDPRQQEEVARLAQETLASLGA